MFRGVITEQGKAWNTEMGYRFNVQNLYALQWFDDYTLQFAQDINQTSKDSMSALAQQAMYEGWTLRQMEDNLGLMFQQWQTGATSPEDWQWYQDRMPPYRRELIARTETMRASNAGSYQLFKEWGSRKKNWLATGDDRTRLTHMEAWGKYGDLKNAIAIDEPFLVGGKLMQHPGDPAGGVAESANCRCAVLPVVDKSAPERQSPGDFENYGAASKWMRANYPQIEFGLQGMPMTHVNEIVREFDRMAQQFPGAADYMKRLKYQDMTANGADKTTTAMTLHKSDNTRGIYFHKGNANWTKDKLKAEKPGIGGWTVTDENYTASTFTHEFGHIFDHWLDAQRNQGFMDVRDGRLGNVSSTWQMWKGRHKLTAKDAKDLSRYGVTLPVENIAEALTAIRYVPESQWSPYLRSFKTAVDLLTGNPMGWSDFSKIRDLRNLTGAERAAAEAELARVRGLLGL